MRAIDADDLEELFREVIGGIAKKPEMNGNLEHMVRASAMVIEMIQDAPTIEPERKKGKWITNSTIINCSVCKHCSWTKSSFKDLVMSFNYCPNCGADMREDGEANADVES